MTQVGSHPGARRPAAPEPAPCAWRTVLSLGGLVPGERTLSAVLDRIEARR